MSNKYKIKEKVRFYNPFKKRFEEGIIMKVSLIKEHECKECENKYEYAIEYDSRCCFAYVLEENIEPI